MSPAKARIAHLMRRHLSSASVCGSPVDTCPSPATAGLQGKRPARHSYYRDLHPYTLESQQYVLSATKFRRQHAIRIQQSHYVSTYATETCASQPVSSGLYSMDICSPSPLNDGSWGLVRSDLGKNIYFDRYTDTKLGVSLSKSGSTCANKASAYLAVHKGYAVTIGHVENACKTPASITVATSVGSCEVSSLCGPSTLNLKTIACPTKPLDYKLEDEAKNIFGSSPYVMMEMYADKTCKSDAPVMKSVYALELCQPQSGGERSFIFTQAQNGSLVYSVYLSRTCTGALEKRESHSSTTCDNFNKVTFFNAKITEATAAVTKSSGGRRIHTGSMFGVLIVAVMLGLLC
ncbi:hypothetical protein BDR26DRAFT_899990 [Obelidium mucronatum]|nr:hypothetical protein BDR26DRAFT_899990 [Obelidium mucronatum]